MSRTYLIDINVKGETFECWVSRNCKYCYGKGSETYRGKKTDLTNTKGEKLYDHQDIPCRCIQLRKKEQKNVENNAT